MSRHSMSRTIARTAAVLAASAMMLAAPVASYAADAGADATAAVAATPQAQASSRLTVSIERTDDLGDKVYVGDMLKYTVTYTNNSDTAFTVFPSAANLSGVLTDGTPNCRWGNLAAGDTKQCTTATHTVTADDLAAGSFTAHTEWKATQDRNGTQVIEDGFVADADPVTVVEGTRPLVPDDATIPTDREDGTAVRLATAGQHGVTCYRIPAIAEAPNGWILTAWDARPGSCADAPQANSIVQRISKDGGKSFETQTVVAAGNPGTAKWGYSDPSYVVDSETGEIFMFFVKSFDQGWAGSQAGTDPTDRNVLQAAVTSSTDNGVTWSEPRVITADITNSSAWTSRFAASGHGIQLKYGKYKGRLIQQYTINNNGNHQAVSVYSDDHGKTWKAGEPVGSGMDENKVVELSDGRVMLNSRPWGGSYRKVAISEDGGMTYGEVTDDTELPDPANNAQITRAFPNAPEGSAAAKILLYSSSSATGRSNGLVRISFDDGDTWTAGKLFKEGAMSYSVITALSANAGGGYGLLYEGDGNDIMYTRVSLDWLGYLSATASADATVKEGETTAQISVNVSNFGRVGYGSLSLAPSAPQGWMAENVTVSNARAGEDAIVQMRIGIDPNAKAGDTITFPVTVSGDGTHGVDGTITLTVEAADVDNGDGNGGETDGDQNGGDQNGNDQTGDATETPDASDEATDDATGDVTAQGGNGTLASTGASVALIALGAAAMSVAGVAAVRKRRA